MTAKYKEGDKVILGEHDSLNGSRNWSPDMKQYVGKQATITRVGTVGSHDLQYYYVDIDNGAWQWRELNMVSVTTSYGCYCTRCTDYNQYIPSDTKNFVCYGCKH